ncbi:MAG: hypothetical protein ACP5T9_03145 [Thermoplasmata archaeon]
MEGLENSLIKNIYHKNGNTATDIIAREVFQNAVDSLIHMFRSNSNFKGKINIWVSKYGIFISDNGTGMDEDTLRKAYGMLGTSMKKDIDSAGFYGIGGKSVLSTAVKVYIISFDDPAKDGHMLILTRGSKEIQYELSVFPNKKNVRGTIIFFRTNHIDFPLPDPAIYNSPWLPYPPRIEYAHDKFLLEITRQARYYSFYAYVNGWDVEIKVNGTTLTIPKEIIEDNYILVSNGDKHLFLFKKPIILHSMKYRVFSKIYDKNATIIIISGISYLVFFEHYEGQQEQLESLYTLDRVEEVSDYKDMAQYYVDFIYIDNAFEFSPSRSSSELLKQIIGKKDIINDMIRNGVDELKKYYFSKLDPKGGFEYINEDCVIHGEDPIFVRVPYFISSGDFPVKPTQKELNIQKFDLLDLCKDREYVYLNTFPVPRFIKKRYFTELTTNLTFTSHPDIYNLYYFLKIGSRMIANGLIFSANKGNISERTVEIIPLFAQASFEHMKNIINGALYVLEDYTPPIQDVPDKTQTQSTSKTNHQSEYQKQQAVAVSNISLERRVTRIRQEHLPVLDNASPDQASSVPVHRKRESRFSDPNLVQAKLFQ